MKARALVLALITTACAANPPRQPASLGGVGVSDFDAAVSRVESLTASETLNAQSCESQLGASEADFLALDPAALDWASADKAALTDRASLWIRTLFTARAKLRQRVPELVLGDLHDPCLRAIRRFLVSGREAEELLTESMNHFGLAPQLDSDSAFSGHFPGTVLNPAFAPFRVLPGDVLLDRGDSAESALIARVTDVENLYSHTAVIGENSRGALFVIETTAQDVVGATPVKKYFADNPDVRMALYRAKDQALARRSARAIYEFSAANAGKVPYDYHMDDSDPKEMFCAEVVQYAYRLGSKGKVLIPRYKSELTRFDVMGKNNWLKQMGVPFSEVYAPADIDVDPRFDEVADYRSAFDIREHRRDDAVLSSMYDWMIDEGYYFPDRLGVHVLSDLGEIKARLFGDEEISKDMPNRVIRTALVFQRVFDIVAANLQKKEDAYYKQTGHPLSFSALKKVNEEFREADCRLWQKDPGQAYRDAYAKSVRYVHESLRSSRACPLLPAR